MTEQEFNALADALVAQGVVADRLEAERRLMAGERLLVSLKVAGPNMWGGIWGTTE